MLSLQRSSCPSSSSHYMTPWFARPAPRGPPPLPQRSLSPMTDEELAAEEESFYDQSEEMTFKNRYPSSCYKKPSNQPQHHQGPPPPSRSSSHHHPQSMILPESHQQHIGGSSTLDSCGSISHHQRSYSSSSCDELDLPSGKDSVLLYEDKMNLRIPPYIELHCLFS